MNYYNENDPRAAQWLRQLIKDGLIPPGDVDERDIQLIQSHELTAYTQCHFFAGIGGWSVALRLAGWPDSEPVWTGSCPCQPFSVSGKGMAEDDERHLWPDFRNLIGQRQPSVVFGEQVASKLGREWLAGVSADMEALAYRFAAADLCAAGVGAPHRRQRLYWVAYANGRNAGTERLQRSGQQRQQSADGGGIAGLGHAESDGRWPQSLGSGAGSPESQKDRRRGELGGSGAEASRVGNTTGAGPQEQWSEYCPSGERCSGLVGLAMQAGVPQWNGPTVAIECSDGPRRASAQPGAFPLAHGVSKRMGKLRGAGNSIVPQLAAVFIQAAMGART